MHPDLIDKLGKCREATITCWAQGRADLPSTPWLAYVNPTNLCNNRCVMCPHQRAMRSERGTMSMDVFKRIIDSLPSSIRKIYLIKQGEPFLNPHLLDMIRYLRAARPEIHIALHTNCTVPFGDRAEDICLLTHSLGLSISAVDPEMYTRIHGQRIDTVIRNLDALHMALEGMHEAERPHIFIDYVRQALNARERMDDVLAFYRRNYPLFGSVDVHPAFNWQGDCDEGNLRIYKILPYQKFPCCVFPWSSITYCHDGKVGYCFEEPRENVFLGDARTQSFKEIWNGAPFVRFRTLMSERRFDQLQELGFYCASCSMLWAIHSQSPQNLTVGYLSKAYKQEREPKYGNLLCYSETEMLSYAMDCYLSGDLHKALGCLNHLEEFCSIDEVRQTVRDLKWMTHSTMLQYKHLYEWRETMHSLGDRLPAPEYLKIGIDMP